MKCENFLCIYEEGGLCSLEEVTLNITGSCDDCIYPDLDPAYLKSRKQALLKRYAQEDASLSRDV